MDSKAIFSSWLTAAGNPLLGVVAAADIVPRRLPDGFKNQRPAIVWFRHAGAPDDYLELDEVLITCRCYGGSVNELAAEQVAEALVARVHRRFSESAGGGRIVSGRVVGRFDWTDGELEHCPVVVVMVELIVE